jgi:peptide/nickel transport system substrate-binding protein
MKRFIFHTAVMLVLAGTAAGSLTACSGSSSGSSGGGSTSKVTIGENADAAPNGYDPLLYSAGQFNFFAGLYDALFVTDASGKVSPSLVATSTDNADHTVLTLTLRDGVTFSDGSTLTSQLVKDNLDRRSDATLAAYGQISATGSSAIKTIATPDAKTVVITWASAQATGASNLADEAGVIVGTKGLQNRPR